MTAPGPVAGVPDAPRRRRRTGWWAFGAALLVAVVALTAVAGPGGVVCGGISLRLGDDAYSAQRDRSAEWAANGVGEYTDEQITQIAATSGYFIIPKFAEGSNLQTQFDTVKRIKAAAKAQGTQVKVFMYINTQYWLTVNNTGWKPWAQQFRASYLMRDVKGQTMPYYGQTGTQADGSKPVGYTVDLTDPAYRQFVLSMAQDWLQQAPLDGVAFDSADPYVGSEELRSTNADGDSTANQLLCGNSTRLDADGNCPRVVAWNDGMADLIGSVTTAFNAEGKEVIYNGVAPSRLRKDRNIAMLQHADAASNEGFCYTPLFTEKARLTFNPLPADIEMMQQAAAQGKKIFEITNYFTDARTPYGDYCLAGFLMGWQPGSSYFIYHEGYTEFPSLPVLADQQLALGNPSSVGYQEQGPVLYRSFDHGFVAVNSGDTPETFTAPRSGSQYSGGKLVGQIGKGGKLALPARSAAFFLDSPSVPTIGSALGVC